MGEILNLFQPRKLFKQNTRDQINSHNTIYGKLLDKKVVFRLQITHLDVPCISKIKTDGNVFNVRSKKATSNHIRYLSTCWCTTLFLLWIKITPIIPRYMMTERTKIKTTASCRQRKTLEHDQDRVHNLHYLFLSIHFFVTSSLLCLEKKNYRHIIR